MKILQLYFENLRPRSKQNGYLRKGHISFLKKSYREWREKVAWIAKQQAMKQGWELNTADALRASWEICWTYAVADIDNIKTGYMDALENVIYGNDAQIDHEGETKLYISKDGIKQIWLTLEVLGPTKWVTNALRKGRDMKKLKGGRKCTISKRELLYLRHTSLG